MDEIKVSDVFSQRLSLHDSIWMLKDALNDLDARLLPVIDARPSVPPGIQKGEDEYHCELAQLLLEDANTAKQCLLLVRSISSRIQL